MIYDGLLTMTYCVLFKGLINELKYGVAGENDSNLASSDAIQQSICVDYCDFQQFYS
jgi:hypothetical protein